MGFRKVKNKVTDEIGGGGARSVSFRQAARDDDAVLIRALRSLDLWRGEVAIEPLVGGITNRNFLAEDEAGRFVARIGEELPLLGVDRRNEAACQAAASRLGIAPELIHRREGLSISRYLPGRTLTPADLRDPGLISQVARALRRLHDSWGTVTGHVLYFCPF
jgi:hypothetical protein